MINNISERAINPFIIDRKNFLFLNTQNRAQSSLVFFAIQQTARANGMRISILENVSKMIKCSDMNE